jgi:hypothetical protein
MKALKISSLLALALLLATNTFAADKGSLALPENMNVNGTQLQAGNYKLAWTGNGSNVELSILKGNKVVATTPARMVELNSPARDNANVVNSAADGSRSLSEVRFAGKKYALAIGAESAKAESSK